MSEEEKEVTQPVVVNGSASAHSIAEGTESVKVVSDEPQAQLPDWLLKFASSPDQAVEESLPDAMPDFQAPYFEDIEEEQAFTPPTIPEEFEWQELSDFQEQEPLEFKPVAAEVDTSENSHESDPGKITELPIPAEALVDPSENFRLEISSLFQNGRGEEALTLIRENKNDPVFAEAAKKTLRSQLTLSTEAGNLWEIYDELNSSSQN